MTLRLLINRALDADLGAILARLSDAALLWAAFVAALLLIAAAIVAVATAWSNRRRGHRTNPTKEDDHAV